MEQHLGPLQLIVEDLGPAGPEVIAAQKVLGYPGMRVVQDDFGNGESVPPVGPDVVAYTGTHDNNTAKGRFVSETDEYRDDAAGWTGAESADFYPDAFVERVWESDALIAVAPMQDLLGLGAGARMNTPGTLEHNWEWRMDGDAMSSDLTKRLTNLNKATNRHI
jgi:4-alpha-glucanotransferase